MKRDATIDDLKEEIRHVRTRHPELSEDNAFVLWFMLAYLTGEEERALQSLVGASRDVNVDALFIDDEQRFIYVLQGKYRTRTKPARENRNDVIALADLGRSLTRSKADFEALKTNASEVVRGRLDEARRKIQNGYRLCLLFVTTGTVSEGLDREMTARGEDRFDCLVFDRRDVLRYLVDYVEGAAPAVPVLDLPVADQVLQRYDDQTKIESWVFTMTGANVAKVFERVGVRLFARNIRGFLGMDTPINQAMSETIRKEPERFWYYNNGVTIVCDWAQRSGHGGRSQLQVNNAQVINGQQTTRVLSAVGHRGASVLVRVIAIPRSDQQERSAYDRVVSRIVEAMNWQNQIRPSDLMSNDPEQVRLERELRKRTYGYLRKRQSKGEARRLIRVKPHALIKKEELAQAVGACLVDPYEVRAGKERLFETDLYPKVFGHHRIDEYLTFYWLRQAVGYMSRGVSRRGYAKWVVLHFLWSRVSAHLSGPRRRDQFIRSVEGFDWWSPRLKPLCTAINAIFGAADRFYYRQRSVDGDVLDDSLFYKRRGQHTSFEAFWRTGKHPHRQRFNAALAKFAVRLEEADDE